MVLDLGCGTGKITRRLRDCGYDLIGVDSSVEMLDIAIEKESDRQEKVDGSILYLNQDMRELDLYGTVKAVVSICDCMNYITDFDDLVTVFKLVNVFLDPKGVFIFDLNTEYKYTSIGETVIAEDRDLHAHGRAGPGRRVCGGDHRTGSEQKVHSLRPVQGRQSCALRGLHDQR